MRVAIPMAGIAALVVSAHAPAQAPESPPTGIPAVDSATAARTAGARASAAFRRGDLAAASREIERATRAWPVQPAYHWARAIIEAHAHDTAGVLDALRNYTALGMGSDLNRDSALAKLVSIPVFAAVVEENETNRAPLVRSVVRLSMHDSTFWPEGADFDPRTRRYYVTSVRQRTIAEVDEAGRARLLWPRDRADMGALMGVRVDTARDVLWATTSGVRQMEAFAPADAAIAALLRIRLRDGDGVVERRWNVSPVAGGHVLGDLVVGPTGDVFMTDSNQPVLYRLRRAGDTLEAVRHPLFHSLQRLAPTPDGRFLYLSDYSHGLLRVDLATNAVIRVADAPRSTSLGCDGIAWDPSHAAIIAVQNGVTPARIMRFVLDGTGTRIERAEVLDRNVAVADEPTIGTVVGRDFIYVANGQWDKHDDSGALLPGRALTPPILLAVPLPGIDSLSQRR